MLHWLYGFCWIAVCRENWVGFCVRNSVSHIYGSFYFSVSGFYVFFMLFLFLRDFCWNATNLDSIYISIYPYDFYAF